MTSFLKKIYHYGLDILFPPVCISCHCTISQQSDFLCRSCFDAIVINTAHICPACGGRKHGIKSCHQTPYTLAPACMYHEPIPHLIHAFKYQKLEGLQTILSALLIVHIQKTLSTIDSFCVSYIPLHTRKERARGFNQSQLLAQMISEYFHIPCIPLLKRVRNTESQAQQHERLKRFENVRDCFSCIDTGRVHGKNILLVDDVSTSGATLLEASRVLRAHHPRTIIGLVVAKAE